MPGLVQLAAQRRDPRLGAQHKLRSKVPQADKDVRPHGTDLLAQEGRAGRNLLGLGVTVSGRAALHHVGNVDLVARKAGNREERVELVPGGTHEGLALQVFISARALAHEHNARVGIAHAKHEVGAHLP